MDSANQLFGTNYQVFNFLAHWSNVVTGTRFDVTEIILPVGISFYTFQTISHTVDVYRRKVAPVKNIIDFGFYVSFFPRLVAGPIVRAAEFILNFTVNSPSLRGNLAMPCFSLSTDW